MALSYQLSGSGTFELSNDFTIKCKVYVIIKYMYDCLFVYDARVGGVQFKINLTIFCYSLNVSIYV